MRCLLVGNYGVGNLGDEALREFFLQTFPDITWVVLTAHPTRSDEVPRLPCGIRSVFKPWWRTLIAVWRSDAVVFGGGSLFTDSESSFACLLWWWHAFVARVFRKPLFMAFQGVGPLRTSGSVWLTKWVFTHSVFISVRDEASINRLRDWKLKTQPVLTFDPIFALFATAKRQLSDQRTLVIIPRDNSGEEFLVSVSGKLSAQWDAIRILLLKPCKEEYHIACLIQSMTKTPCQIVEISSPEKLLAEIGSAREVVTQRYHGALAAMAMEIPVTIISQSAGDKLEELRLIRTQSPDCAALRRKVEVGEQELARALGTIRPR